MELLTNIIVEYLKHNKRLVVPKLGAFIVKQGEGRVMFSELMRGDDGVLRSLLVAYGISDIEASGLIDRLVFELRHAVSQGQSFTIEGLGSFTAGENNTITFKQYREPRSVGGSVRPPFEHLNEAKRSLRSRQGVATTNRVEQPKRTTQAKGSASKQRQVEEDSVNLTKPESYLRGLKYENKKSKGRDEEYYGGDKRKPIDIRKLLVLLGALLIFGVAGWLVLDTIFNSGGDSKTTSDTLVIEQNDTMVINDTVPKIDSIPTTMEVAGEVSDSSVVVDDKTNNQ